MNTRQLRDFLLLLAAVVSVSCAPAQPGTTSVRTSSLGRDIPAFQAHEQQEDSEPFVEPTATVTLNQALTAALLNNPRLATFAWKLRVAEADTLQAQLRPNPVLGVELENFGGSGELSGFDASETTILLSQLIELGAKRGKRLALSARERDLANWDYETVRIDVFTETTRAFSRVLAVQRRLTLADELVQVAEEFLTSVSRRVKAGSVSPVEEGRARVELATSRMERDKLRSTLLVAKQHLSEMWGSSVPQFTEAIGNLEQVKAVPTLEAMQQRLSQTPELARWATELERHQAALALERALGKPDLTFSAGVRRIALTDADATAFIVGMELPLPVFARNQGTSLAAEYRVHQARQEERDATIRTRSRLARLHATLLALDGEVTTLRDHIIPEASHTFETAQLAYNRGAMRLTDVLDTERQLFELKDRYYSSLADYHGAVADLERLTGESLERTLDHTEIPRP